MTVMQAGCKHEGMAQALSKAGVPELVVERSAVLVQERAQGGLRSRSQLRAGQRIRRGLAEETVRVREAQHIPAEA